MGTSGLHIVVRADSAELGGVRRAVSAWLRDRGAPAGLTSDVLLTVDEAVANSVEHGYRGLVPGPVVVDLDLDHDGLLVSISDEGRWRPPVHDPASFRGRGLGIMRTLATAVALDTDSGTTVTARFAVAAPQLVAVRT
ncbi:ATP-binding protein [Actinokineospora bangkokensis]|uniref:Histidine kinase/HSP90-like ATPase domain-containing protein n=1 Tax=Actinokineospora bangkokensis TaxID=1193682 RepID=A0A1Q9LNE1_9PSEU|nr:ATP-binding protein [Actinokineospora bangkokensis]OLR93538.1 hypothetical protein BJP25_14660 [Actinokineospora bangkokensis]